ncbi:MAG: HAMP domain-containing protein [Burkholderiales bacterium]|nr:HAMP domain-containing protein [Burkholderiales bacterium]
MITRNGRERFMKLNDVKITTRLMLGFGLVLALLLVIAATSFARLVQTQADLDAEVTTEKGKALLATIAEKRADYLELRAKLQQHLTSSDQSAVGALLKEKLLPSVETYLGAMSKLKNYEDAQAAEHAGEVRARVQAAKRTMLILVIASLFVGIGGAVVITRSVTGPIGEAVEAARVIADTDLSHTLESSRKDELGELLHTLGQMQISLRQIVGHVRPSTADSITTASTEIAPGNQNLSVRTEQTASNLLMAASSMEQLTVTAKQSPDSARQANRLAASAAEVAARGGLVESRVAATMDDINASSKKISDISGVIDGIAFQANILALNAAVEAARAGDQGRGFAVVAGEVRRLAQRSAQAAKEIKGLMGASVDTVEGSTLVADAGHTMQEIIGSVQRVTNIIDSITTASSEHSDGMPPAASRWSARFAWSTRRVSLGLHMHRCHNRRRQSRRPRSRSPC